MSRFKHLISTALYGPAFAILPSGRPKEAEEDLTVIFLASLGDLVVFTAAAEALRKNGRRITLVCRQNRSIEEYAALTGLYGKVVPLRHGYLSRAANMIRLRKIRTETVIIAPVERHILSDLYALSVSARRRIFPDTVQGSFHPALKKRADRRADVLVPVSAVNEQERYEQYLRNAGLADGPVMPYGSGLSGAGQTPPSGEGTIAVFPGAGGGDRKRWPVELFAEAVNGLRSGAGRRVAVCGTAEERGLGEALCRLVPGAENLCGRMTIAELIRFFSGVCLTVSNDTGSAHLSAACSVPTVVVCGAWEYGRFYPNSRLPDHVRPVLPHTENLGCVSCRSRGIECGSGPVAGCVESVTVREVLAACRDVLAESEG